MAPPRIVRTPSEERERRFRCAEARRARIRALTDEQRAYVRAKNAAAQRRRRQRPEVRAQEAEERVRRREERRREAEEKRLRQRNAAAAEASLQQCGAVHVNAESRNELCLEAVREQDAVAHHDGLQNAAEWIQEAEARQCQYLHEARPTQGTEAQDSAVREQEVEGNSEWYKQVVALWEREAEAHSEWRQNVAVLEQEAKRRRQCSAVRVRKTEAHCEHRLEVVGREQQAEERRQRRQNRAVRTQEAESHCTRHQYLSMRERNSHAKQRRRMVESLQRLYAVICATNARGTTDLHSIKQCSQTGS